MVKPARVRVHPDLRRTCYTRRADGLHLTALSVLAGFADPSGLIHQLRKPFAPTKRNVSRWRVVAEVVGHDGEPLEPVS